MRTWIALVSLLAAGCSPAEEEMERHYASLTTERILEVSHFVVFYNRAALNLDIEEKRFLTNFISGRIVSLPGRASMGPDISRGAERHLCRLIERFEEIPEPGAGGQEQNRVALLRTYEAIYPGVEGSPCVEAYRTLSIDRNAGPAIEE
jgi:hypothetical protein